MGVDPAPFDRLAALLAYPRPGFERAFDEALDALEAVDRELAEHLGPLARRLGASSHEEMEELYTRTFDINPLCSLEIGWQLYGEDYNRGEFMVRMRTMMRAVGVEEAGELPDHLTHAIPVLARLDEDAAKEMASGFVLPAMRKMLDGFPEAENPYRGVLEGLRALVVHVFGDAEAVLGAATPRETPYDGIPGSVPGLPPMDPGPAKRQEV